MRVVEERVPEERVLVEHRNRRNKHTEGLDEGNVFAEHRNRRNEHTEVLDEEMARPTRQ